MTKKESKTKAKPVSKGKKALAELARLQDDLKKLDQQMELQKKLGHSVYTQAEVDQYFVLNEERTAPFFRGKERKKQGEPGEPVVLVKCEYKRGREDLFYVYRKGRDALRLENRYGKVKAKPKETIREKIDQAQEKREKLTLSERYGKKKAQRRY